MTLARCLRVLGAVTAAFAVILFALAIFMTIQDDGDGNWLTNLSNWIVPFAWLSAGLTLACAAWVIASIDQRLARVEKKD